MAMVLVLGAGCWRLAGAGSWQLAGQHVSSDMPWARRLNWTEAISRA
jgi:hypothetical protein